MKSIFKTIAIILFAPFFLSTCNDNTTYTNIPDVYINYELNLNLPQFSSLIHPGNFVYIENEGYRGVIVYHNYDNNYIALERTCTYEPEKECSMLYVDDSGLFIRCGEKDGDCCDSKFEMDGNVFSGPAIYPLKRYGVTAHGDFLTITNIY